MNTIKYEKKKRLLIVDDQALMITALSQILEENYTIQAATRGRKALEIVSGANPPDLILLDITMPDMDGYEVCRILKSEKNTREIPVIFITARDAAEDERFGLQLGAADYIKKPYNPAIVKARILTHLQLKEHNKHLEELVNKRTSQLAEANRRITVLDNDKLHFLRYLSHEMNTPLNYIGISKVIDKSKMGEENLQFISIIEKGFDRLNKLIKEVISYFELAADDQDLDVKEITLNDMVLNTLKKYKEIAEAINIKIQTQLEDDIRVQASPEYLTEVLDTIIKNAIVFSETDGRIIIESKIVNEKVILTISDQGRGIDKLDLEKIFKPFATDEHNRNKGGFGLNLPRAKIISNTYGWQIRAESKGKGYGAKFIIDFGE